MIVLTPTTLLPALSWYSDTAFPSLNGKNWSIKYSQSIATSSYLTWDLSGCSDELYLGRLTRRLVPAWWEPVSVFEAAATSLCPLVSPSRALAPVKRHSNLMICAWNQSTPFGVVAMKRTLKFSGAAFIMFSIIYHLPYKTHTKICSKQSEAEIQTDQIFLGLPVQPMISPQFAHAHNSFCFKVFLVLNIGCFPHSSKGAGYAVPTGRW